MAAAIHRPACCRTTSGRRGSRENTSRQQGGLRRSDAACHLDFVGVELVHNYFLIEMKTITAAEANRKFSQILRTVSQGEDVLIVSCGRSVARVEAVSLGGRGKAREELLRRLQGQALTGSRTWQRDQHYDR